MAIKYAPARASIRICDFRNTIYPEISKKRPVIILSCPAYNLCTVVPCSTTPPKPVCNWHYLLKMDQPLPAPYDSPIQWVKCDLIMTVSFSRLSIPHVGKGDDGKRIYDNRLVSKEDFDNIIACTFHAHFPWMLDF